MKYKSTFTSKRRRMNATPYIKKLFDILNTVKVTGSDMKEINLDAAVSETIDLIKKYSGLGKKLLFIGNGGSAAIASHEAIDFSKNGKIRSMCFNEASLLTCLGNDYGYEYVFEKSMEIFADREDVLIAISSSGKSPNILKAIDWARKMNCKIITFSGFSEDNPLRKSGDYNYYVNSGKYGFVELSHQTLLHMILDIITGDWRE